MAPRQVHALFTNDVLRGIAQDPSVDLLTDARSVNLGPKFVEIWDGLNSHVDESDRIPSQGLAAYVVERPDYEAVLVTLPKPVEAGEPYAAIAVTDAGGHRRYYTWDLGPDETVHLGGWLADGGDGNPRHEDLGERHSSTIDAFLDEVGAHLSQG